MSFLKVNFPLDPQILANVEKLGIPEEFKDYERALLAHRELDKMVSKPVLPTDFKGVIQAWREAVLELFLARDITMPNKMHIVYHHLEVYKFNALTVYILLDSLYLEEDGLYQIIASVDLTHPCPGLLHGDGREPDQNDGPDNRGRTPVV